MIVAVVVMAGACSSDVSARDVVEAQLAESGSETERLNTSLIATADYPDSGWSHLLLGEQYLARLEYPQAVLSLERSVELDGADALARARLAEALLAVGRESEALTQLEAGFESGLDDSWRETQGLLLSRLERYDDLLALADGLSTDALADDPSLADRMRYTAYRGLGDDAGTDRALARARELVPDLAAAQAGAASAEYDAARFRSAFEYAELAVAADPDSAAAAYQHGRSLLQLGRLEEAQAAFVALGELAPERTEGPVFEALTLVELGRPADAVSIMDEVAIAFPDLPGVQGIRAEVLAAAGDAAAALEAAEAALAVNPDDPLVLLGLAAALLVNDDRGGSFSAAERVVAEGQTVTGRPEAILAAAAIELGRADIAVAAATQSVARAPDLWRRQLLLARAYALAGLDTGEPCAAAARAAEASGVTSPPCP